MHTPMYRLRPIAPAAADLLRSRGAPIHVADQYRGTPVASASRMLRSATS